MYQEFYANNPLVSYALLAFLIFFAIFTAVIVQFIFSNHRSHAHDAATQLPLEDDSHG